jgi:hypothetical protein
VRRRDTRASVEIAVLSGGPAPTGEGLPPAPNARCRCRREDGVDDGEARYCRDAWASVEIAGLSGGVLAFGISHGQLHAPQ